jgi:hypothetical protein
MMICGWLLNYMKNRLGYDEVAAYKIVFWGYAVIGIIKFCLAIALSNACEAEKRQAPPIADPETAPLLGDGAEDEEPKKKQSRLLALLPEISKESRIIVANLCILFALDAFASGLASL